MALSFPADRLARNDIEVILMTADQLPLHIVIIAVFRQAENAVGLIDSNIIPDSPDACG